MTREEARQKYHQYRETLRAYPDDHRERLAYEAIMAEMARKFPGIESEK